MADIVNEIQNAGSTFTSWDSCMSKAYCKWSVIGGIIIGSVIVLSILWCIFSCLCCGISLCTACGRCLTCFGCCGMCKGGRSRKRDPEYHPMPPTPTPYQGYQPQSSPMMYNNHGPQTATFDAGTKRSANIHEDSLPAMPSWDNAQTKRVKDHNPQHKHQDSDMELEHMLPQHGQRGPASPTHHRFAQSQPYASDLGAQRLNQQPQGYSSDYYDAPRRPLSPAPTYHSTASAAAMGNGRFYGEHASSPPPVQHQQNTGYDRENSNSVAPYPSSRESTQFGLQQTSMSPPSQQPYTPYHSPPPQETGVRPPSLLQVGRKPVAGSYREV